MQTLAERFDGLEDLGALNKEILPHILDNLNPDFALRPYQESALKRFLYYAEDYLKRPKPSHILFEMATGSGKTLIMAALILDLYQRGYRNFMFFVNATNIIEKTKDNFLNNHSAKYLFAQKIIIDGKAVNIRPVENFDEANPDDINIHFTTIQGLHMRLNKPSENTVTYEDFKGREIVLLSDEAHHTNALTKTTPTKAENEKETSWENTVQRIFDSDTKNYLLEFTATANLDHPRVKQKYDDKILYRYALKEFRTDGYSKEVDVLQADMPPLERAFQAVILSQYRRKIAEKNGLHIKPVILMKSKTIKESQKNETQFHDYMDKLTPEEINKVAAGSSDVIKSAFDFFLTGKDITPANLVRELQQDFSREKCLSVNSQDDSMSKQIEVNTLEDTDNETRIIFVVDKLNEGWDVLNLFDIVRLYETRDSGKGTIKEAQLIGRGARYCPFVSPETQKAEIAKDMRKYDDDTSNDLRMLETLYYHCAHNPQYIREIRRALVKSGIMTNGKMERHLKVKDKFKQSDFYKKQSIFVNERVTNKRDGMFAVGDYLRVTDFDYGTMLSGKTDTESALNEKASPATHRGDTSKKTFRLKGFPTAILQRALDQSNFFHFDCISHYFPKMEKMDACEFLKLVKVDVRGSQTQINAPSPQTMLKIALFALDEIKNGIKNASYDYEGTKTFKPKPIKEIVKDKTLNIALNDTSEQEFGQPWAQTRIAELRDINLFEKDWFVYDTNFGTDQEKYLIGYISDRADRINEQYDEFYLIRNEGGFKLYAFEDGRAMEPDFVLCARKKHAKQSTIHQIFIEPKGEHIADGDRWKEGFLEAIEGDSNATTEIHGHKYILIGMPFYDRGEVKVRKNKFTTAFAEKLSIDET